MGTRRNRLIKREKKNNSRRRQHGGGLMGGIRDMLGMTPPSDEQIGRALNAEYAANGGDLANLFKSAGGKSENEETNTDDTLAEKEDDVNESEKEEEKVKESEKEDDVKEPEKEEVKEDDVEEPEKEVKEDDVKVNEEEKDDDVKVNEEEKEEETDADANAVPIEIVTPTDSPPPANAILDTSSKDEVNPNVVENGGVKFELHIDNITIQLSGESGSASNIQLTPGSAQELLMQMIKMINNRSETSAPAPAPAPALAPALAPAPAPALAPTPSAVARPAAAPPVSVSDKGEKTKGGR